MTGLRQAQPKGQGQLQRSRTSQLPGAGIDKPIIINLLYRHFLV